VPVLHVLDDALVHPAGLGVPEGEDVVEIGGQPAADGDEERVIGQLPTLGRANDAPGGVGRGDGVFDPLRAAVAAYVPDLVAASLAEPDRLTSGHRPVDELVVGRDES
jgi:hypothetical protein